MPLSHHVLTTAMESYLGCLAKPWIGSSTPLPVFSHTENTSPALCTNFTGSQSNSTSPIRSYSSPSMALPPHTTQTSSTYTHPPAVYTLTLTGLLTIPKTRLCILHPCLQTLSPQSPTTLTLKLLSKTLKYHGYRLDFPSA